MRRLKPGRKTAQASVILFAVTLAFTADVNAQDETHFGDALELHLAYVKTGDSRIDARSEAAMEGLRDALTKRTTIEPTGVRGIDPETDTLIYYPFLYWPVERNAPGPSDKAVTALNDSGDQALLVGNPHPGLKTVTSKLEIPSLAEVPEDHVLNKSFFLIDIYPGRWANGRVWVDSNRNGAARDGVSSVIIGSNDWAAAWAQDENGTPMVHLERDIPKQREMALRFGVNLVMYTLAGNYKADQVHSAALIERLGRQQRQPQNLGPDDGDEE